MKKNKNVLKLDVGDNMILTKDIIQEGHPTLNKVAKVVEFPLSNHDKELANNIMQYIEMSMNESYVEKYNLRPAVGLAAPQVNESIRMMGIIIPAFEEGESDFARLFINPKIISHSEKMCYLSSGEGCLSVEESIVGLVPRYKKITIEAYDIHGKKFKLRLKDYHAIVFQHEYDHLEGIVFTQKVTKDVSNLEAI